MRRHALLPILCLSLCLGLGLGFGLGLGLPGPAQAASAVTVLDGDTLRIAGVSYRLHGIDAPEKRQYCRKNGLPWLCGQEAAAYLRGLIGRHAVSCAVRGRDRYGRMVAVCRAGGLELNRAMVRAGMAWAYRHYARDYEDAELEAAIAKRGLWAEGVQAQPAWDWRRGRGKGRSGRNPGLTAF
ncbi:MAG TPA: thermonuclease family protein [Ferrovibrio sp.]|uniref:thermonuclease family protein n=1 Tax=Ferrovibrio sp. TaxID=1917215 RepID=UPI002ED40795